MWIGLTGVLANDLSPLSVLVLLFIGEGDRIVFESEADFE